MAVAPETVNRFYQMMCRADLADSYEARHARLILEHLKTITERRELIAEKKVELLPESSQEAADRSYIDTVMRLTEGFLGEMTRSSSLEDAHHRKVSEIWERASMAQ